MNLEVQLLCRGYCSAVYRYSKLSQIGNQIALKNWHQPISNMYYEELDRQRRALFSIAIAQKCAIFMPWSNVFNSFAVFLQAYALAQHPVFVI